MKPTRTDNNKPSQSTPIRKGKVSDEEIKKTAQELTRIQNNAVYLWKCMWVTTDEAINNINNSFKVVEAPKIESVEHWNYEIYSEYIKAHCKVHDTYETTGDELKKIFPQNKSVYDIVRNLKRSHNISWRRVENWDNDTYVFFVEPTREELIVQLTSAESKVIQLEQVIDSSYKEYCERYNWYYAEKQKLVEENSQLKSYAITYSYKVLTLWLLLWWLLVYLYLHINWL